MKIQPDVLQFYTIQPLNMKIVLFISADLKKIHKELDKKSNHEMKEFVARKLGKFEVSDNMDGGLYYNAESRRPVMIMFSRHKDKEYFLDIVIHETTHLVQQIEEYAEIEDEVEFRAYLTEMLCRDFRTITAKKT